VRQYWFCELRSEHSEVRQDGVQQEPQQGPQEALEEVPLEEAQDFELR
jgi:hypothetical protein